MKGKNKKSKKAGKADNKPSGYQATIGLMKVGCIAAKTAGRRRLVSNLEAGLPPGFHAYSNRFLCSACTTCSASLPGTRKQRL